jgi:FKBP-type peptidyl-prolyl cis-trans isomerase 2
MVIKQGDRVTISYIGKFDDGTIFDSTDRHENPLIFQVGENPPQVIKGFEEAVIGMGLEEEKEFRLDPKLSYGEYNPQLVHEVPRDQLPEGIKPKIGMVLGLIASNGQKIPVMVTDVKETTLTIDMNHPLAGEALNFQIKILEIESTED